MTYVKLVAQRIKGHRFAIVYVDPVRREVALAGDLTPITHRLDSHTIDRLVLRAQHNLERQKRK